MYTIRKRCSNTVKAYQLGSPHEVIQELIAQGRIRDNGDGTYRVFSREVQSSDAGGQLARAGDWIKLDSEGFPYPNGREFFEANHRYIAGDDYLQSPQTLQAWDAGQGEPETCPEIQFLIAHDRLHVHEDSEDSRYTADLWGTTEHAAADDVIVFYHDSIEYDAAGRVRSIGDFNFVARAEFERTYDVCDGIEVESIISLETGERYVVLDETGYQGTQYYLIMGVDPQDDIIEHDIAICCADDDGEDTYITRVADLELVCRLVRQFKRQERDKNSNTSNPDETQEIGTERKETASLVEEMRQAGTPSRRRPYINDEELMDRIDAMMAVLDAEAAEEDGVK